MPDVDVRDGIRPAIEASGKKRIFIAGQAGMTRQQLCDIESKRRKLEANEMFALCRAIGTTPDALYEAATKTIPTLGQ